MIRKRGEPMIGREYLFLLVCFMPFFRPTVHCLVPLWAIPFLRLPGLTLQMSTNLLASTKATIVRSELLCLLYPSLPKARILWVPAAYISVDCQHKCQSFNYWSSVNCFLYYIIYIRIHDSTYSYFTHLWTIITPVCVYTYIHIISASIQLPRDQDGLPHHRPLASTAARKMIVPPRMERPDVASHQGFDGMIVPSRVASKSSCFQFFFSSCCILGVGMVTCIWTFIWCIIYIYIQR